jgi:hypothetical protein
MPERSAVQIRTVAEGDPGVPIYVPDSANTATSMSSGIVTSTGRIATTATTDRDVPTIMELANAAGFGTGIVTTSSVTDATPASFVAHVSERLCESPSGMVRINERIPAFSTDCSADLKANGGAGSIAEQIAASPIDIVLGGGAQYFAEPAEGGIGTVHDLAAASGFHLLATVAELESLPPDGKVLGLFSRGTMPVQWRGTADAAAARVSHGDDGRFELPEPFTCEPNPAFDGLPRLAEMARRALERLDDGRSFVLMIESASIDKQSHLRRPCGQIGELAQLDERARRVECREPGLSRPSSHARGRYHGRRLRDQRFHPPRRSHWRAGAAFRERARPRAARADPTDGDFRSHSSASRLAMTNPPLAGRPSRNRMRGSPAIGLARHALEWTLPPSETPSWESRNRARRIYSSPMLRGGA